MRPLTPDPALKGLALALDVDAFLELLRKHLPECRDEIDLISARILDVAYKPGVHCLLHYSLKLTRRGAQRKLYQAVSVALLADGESPPPLPSGLLERYERRRNRFVLRTPFLVLPDAGMVVYAFPIDLRLPWLFDALDETAMKRSLGRMWKRRRLCAQSVDIGLISYTPQARATLTYEILAEDVDTGVPERRRLIGKMHAHKNPARLFAAAWALWRAADGRLNFAPPAGLLVGQRLTLQERVRGERMGALTEPAKIEGAARAAGRALAVLHSLSVPLIGRRDPADEARVIRRWGGVLLGIRTDLTRRVERLRDDLAREIEARAQVRGPLHGDFHHTNILVHGDRITLIDLDEVGYGDPCVDVGRFLASMRVPALRTFGDPESLAGAREAFLAEYLAATGEDLRRVRLFEAAALLVSASSAFRIQKEGWEAEAATLIAESERLLQESTTQVSGPPASLPRPSRVYTDEASARDCFPDRLRWAADRVYMQAALARAVDQEYGAHATSCALTLEREADHGRRFRYVIEGFRGDQQFTVSLEGYVRRSRGGSALVRRLTALGEAMRGVDGALRLPRPVVYLAALMMTVLEPPRGTRLGTVIFKSGGRRAMERVGRSLATLHGVKADGIEKERALSEEFEPLRGLALGLQATQPDASRRAMEILAEVERRLRPLPQRRAPVLRTLSPHVLLLDGDAVAVHEVREIALSHPLVDLASLLARTALLGVERGQTAAASQACTALVSGYLAAGGIDQELGAFEAMAILRPACTRAEADPALAARLLAAAEERLAGDRLALAAGPPAAGRTRPRTPDAVDRVDRAVRDLHALLAERCDGPTAVIGHDRRLASTVRKRGFEVVELPLEPTAAAARLDQLADAAAQGSRHDLSTVIVRDLLRRCDPATGKALLAAAFGLVSPGGRLIVAVDNDGCVPDPQGGRDLRERELKSMLRELGHPRVGKDQPYRWIVIQVDKPGEAGPAMDRVKQARLRATAALCRGRVLELGCGPGELSHAIGERGLTVVGLDRNAIKVGRARSLYPDLPFLQGDASQVPFTEPFDTVVIAELLEHVPDHMVVRILDEAWRLTRAGGRLVVSVPNEGCVPHRNHLREYDRRSLKGLLGRFGRPRLVTEQPYRWLLMYVERRAAASDRP